MIIFAFQTRKHQIQMYTACYFGQLRIRNLEKVQLIHMVQMKALELKRSYTNIYLHLYINSYCIIDKKQNENLFSLHLTPNGQFIRLHRMQKMKTLNVLRSLALSIAIYKWSPCFEPYNHEYFLDFNQNCGYFQTLSLLQLMAAQFMQLFCH